MANKWGRRWIGPHDFYLLRERMAKFAGRGFRERTYRIGEWAVTVRRAVGGGRTPVVTVRPAHEAVRPYWHRPEDDWRVDGFTWAD
jgi:hypothetical protein